jgi:hypothetical protein
MTMVCVLVDGMSRKAKAQAGKDYQEEKHLRVGGIDLLVAPGTEQHQKVCYLSGHTYPILLIYSAHSFKLFITHLNV